MNMARLTINAPSPLVLALAASNSLLVLHLFHPRWLGALRAKLRLLITGSTSTRTTVSAEALGGLLGSDYQPPLPQPVADALGRSRLCFLATAGASLEPHLSLMRFTYTQGLDPAEPASEVLVISTQRKTKKFEILTENEKIALLVHDFQTHSDAANEDYAPVDNRPRYSITLNGTVRVEEGELAEKYRAVHLSRNAAYKQFIGTRGRPPVARSSRALSLAHARADIHGRRLPPHMLLFTKPMPAVRAMMCTHSGRRHRHHHGASAARPRVRRERQGRALPAQRRLQGVDGEHEQWLLAAGREIERVVSRCWLGMTSSCGPVPGHKPFENMAP